MQRILLTLLLVAAASYGLWAWIEQPFQKKKPVSVASTPVPLKPVVAPLPANATPEEKAWAALEAQALEGAVGKGVQLNVTQNQKKCWEIDVEKAIYTDKRQQAHLKQVHGTFFDITGKPVATFKAPFGLFEQKTEVLTLTGGLLLNTEPGSKQPGLRLKAPKLRWAKATKEWLETSGGVTISLAKLGQTNASVARFTTDFSRMELKGGVESVITGAGKVAPVSLG